MKSYLIGLFILLAFLGCTKLGKNITVKGRVLNPITGQGIEGAELNLLRGTLELPGGEKSVKKVFTDANGNYEISKFSLSGLSLSVGNLGDRYAIGWYQDGQITVKNNNNLSVKKRKTMHVDFHAVEYGEIKIPIHNINCQGPTDTLLFKRNYISFENISVFQPFTLTGCVNNEGAFAKVPSGKYSIEWTVIRNGVSQNFNHILTVPGNGQAEYVLNY